MENRQSSVVNGQSEWMPPYFVYEDGELCLDGVRLSEIAQEFGTPCYVYSARSIREAYRRYSAAFAKSNLDLTLCYAVKANSNLSVLRLLAELGAGADVVSAGELYRALEAGIPPDKIVFAGVGKTVAEIDFALSKHIRAFNVESWGELELIAARAAVAGSPEQAVGISIRVNPDVDAVTHPYHTTGKKNNKFGLAVPTAKELAALVHSSPRLKLRALQMHIGSQLLDVQPIGEAFKRLLALAAEIEAQSGRAFEYLDIGGGLGASYIGETPQQPDVLAGLIAQVLNDSGKNYPIFTEPGRYLVAESGAMLTEVLYIKRNDEVNFAIVDAGMNDLLRPALYQATHKIVPLVQTAQASAETYEVVGPVCESGDWLGHAVPLAGIAPGARLAMLTAGAYCFVMTSNYNTRLRPPEILVDGGTARLIRKRETLEGLLASERI
jgi:diaminopimelate decarboxylase